MWTSSDIGIYKWSKTRADWLKRADTDDKLSSRPKSLNQTTREDMLIHAFAVDDCTIITRSVTARYDDFIYCDYIFDYDYI